MKTLWMLTIQKDDAGLIRSAGLLVPAALMESIHGVLQQWTGDYKPIAADQFETIDEVRDRMRSEMRDV